MAHELTQTQMRPLRPIEYVGYGLLYCVPFFGLFAVTVLQLLQRQRQPPELLALVLGVRTAIVVALFVIYGTGLLADWLMIAANAMA